MFGESPTANAVEDEISKPAQEYTDTASQELLVTPEMGLMHERAMSSWITRFGDHHPKLAIHRAHFKHEAEEHAFKALGFHMMLTGANSIATRRVLNALTAIRAL